MTERKNTSVCSILKDENLENKSHTRINTCKRKRMVTADMPLHAGYYQEERCKNLHSKSIIPEIFSRPQ
jgi:hypothetical protein